MNSQKVPKFVEVPKQQHKDLNVDEPVEMQRQITSTHRKQKVEQVPVPRTSGTRRCRDNDTCQWFEGHKSQHSNKERDAS